MPLASLVTNRIINVYGFLVVMLLIYSVLIVCILLGIKLLLLVVKRVWQTDFWPDGRVGWTIHRAAWSQFKTWTRCSDISIINSFLWLTIARFFVANMRTGQVCHHLPCSDKTCCHQISGRYALLTTSTICCGLKKWRSSKDTPLRW